MDKPNGVKSNGGMQNSSVMQAKKISPATVSN